MGPPPLLFTIQTALKALTPLLGDIGCVPVELLWSALSAAAPEELAAIEDATLTGVASRDIRPATWPLWWRHCTAGSLPSLTQLPAKLPPLAAPSAPPPATAPRDAAPADWRTVYEGLARQLEERRSRLGHRLKQQREEEQRRKASRSIQASLGAKNN